MGLTSEEHTTAKSLYRESRLPKTVIKQQLMKSCQIVSFKRDKKKLVSPWIIKAVVLFTHKLQGPKLFIVQYIIECAVSYLCMLKPGQRCAEWNRADVAYLSPTDTICTYSNGNARL